MKKFICLVVFLLIALALTPWIDGFLFKKQFLNLVTTLNQDNRIKINVIDYETGWLTSTIKIHIIHPTPGLPVKGIAPIELTLEEIVTHGPIIFDQSRQQFIPALAMIESHLHIPQALEKLVLGATQSKGILQITTVASFNGNWTHHIQIPILNMKLSSGGQLAWEGLTGESNMQVTNQQIDTLDGHITLGEFSVTDLMNKQLDIKPISLSYNGVRHPFGLWVGKFKITVPNFLLKNINGSNVFYIENLSATTENNINTASLYNASQQLSLQKINWPSSDISSISFLNLMLAAENFNPEGVAHLSEIVISNEKFNSQLLELAAKTFTSTSTLNADLSFNTQLGGFLLKGKASKFFSTTSTSLAEMTKASDIEINIRISAALAKKIYESYFQALEIKSTPLIVPNAPNLLPIAPVKILDQASIEKFNQKIADLMKQGKVSLSTSMQLMTLARQNFTPEQFTNNIKMLKLAPSVENQITQQYNLSLEKAVNVQSAADTAKNTLNEWIQLGYLIPEKNDYLLAVFINNGEVKINGKLVK